MPVSCKLKALAKVLLILVHSGEMDLMASVVVVTFSGLIDRWEVQACFSASALSSWVCGVL